jgi:hypothetical protein
MRFSRTPSVKTPDGILPAPPIGGAFWRYLDFVENIRFFGDLVGALLTGLKNRRKACVFCRIYV